MTLADAIAGNDYLSFTLTPKAGHSFSISSVSATFSSSSGAGFTIALLSSATGFTAGDALWSFYSSGLLGGTSALQTADLSSVTALLALSNAVEFRFYGYYDSGSGTIGISDIAGINDLTISGIASAVPEPSTYVALMGAAALAFAVWRRRAAPCREASRAPPAGSGPSPS